jgi:hypothetical protein
VRVTFPRRHGTRRALIVTPRWPQAHVRSARTHQAARLRIRQRATRRTPSSERAETASLRAKHVLPHQCDTDGHVDLTTDGRQGFDSPARMRKEGPSPRLTLPLEPCWSRKAHLRCCIVIIADTSGLVIRASRSPTSDVHCERAVSALSLLRNGIRRLEGRPHIAAVVVVIQADHAFRDAPLAFHLTSPDAKTRGTDAHKASRRYIY